MIKILTMKMPQRQFTSNTNILLIGVDRDAEGTSRADTIMLANINPYTKYIGLLSIPRDTRMYVSGHNYTKINHAYAYGGQKLLRQSLSNYLRVPIPYYIELDFRGIVAIVDDLGGVPMYVDKRMHYVDRAGDLYIDLYPGQQVLDGNHAMQYVRFRGDVGGDIGRVKRQQSFIQAMGKKIFNIGVVFRGPRLLFQFSRHVKTNMPSTMITGFAMKVREAYELGHLDLATLPGTPIIVDGIDYLQPDWNEAQKLINRVVKGYEFYTPALPPVKRPPELRVEVLNGNGSMSLARNASKKISKLGYAQNKIRNAGRFDYKQSVIVNWHGEGNEDEAFILARKLYINPKNIINLNNPQKPIDFSLVVGKDWPLER